MRDGIVLSGVSKTYEGKTVLQDVSLRFEEGKVTAIMGPSGQGKTTLLKILLGLEDCEGTVSGMEGRRPAVVFQESRLLPWLSLKQNLELVCGPGKDREITEALALMELTDAADKKPSELSGGMQRRAALARAIAYGGDILVLDEPFTGLDEALKERIAGKLAA
ncbi:MAG: ABC transporter ATP-binding protein, partial [Firmicutes bacterium]|nr:ABC transporter ATP-binding protein [Bacillota bacterium]